jgi:UDP-glucose 4-epimerase
MKILVTGSAGHLGEALMRRLPQTGHQPIGFDLKASGFTHEIGSITDRRFVNRFIRGIHAVLYTATLHKPHLATHARQDFVDTNITGTLNLLEEAAAAGVSTFVLTSTTSTFGRALTPSLEGPAAPSQSLGSSPENRSKTSRSTCRGRLSRADFEKEIHVVFIKG